MKTNFFETVKSVNHLSGGHYLKLDDNQINLWVETLKKTFPELTIYNLNIIINRMIIGKIPYDYFLGINNILDAYKNIVNEQMKYN